jgi:hypothetical protein
MPVVQNLFSCPLRSEQGLYDRSGSVLLPGYVVGERRIADRRMILAGYRLADLLTRLLQ